MRDKQRRERDGARTASREEHTGTEIRPLDALDAPCWSHRVYCPSGCTARRCIVWRYEPPPESPDRANVVNPMTPRKHVPRHQRGGGWALCG